MINVTNINLARVKNNASLLYKKMNIVTSFKACGFDKKPLTKKQVKKESF